MDVCILQGKSVTPEMPGACSRCGLYLNTCSPIIENGFLVGAECDYDYCCDCPHDEDCGWQKGDFYERESSKTPE